jgi:hypothetical protein
MKAELTVAEAAAAVGRTPAAIYQWIGAGDSSSWWHGQTHKIMLGSDTFEEADQC